MGEGERRRILVVDDDAELGDLLRTYLIREGFSCLHVADGEAGLEEALSGRHDLAVLDVMLPQRGGFDVLREIRGQSDLPVVMLTARGDPVDRVVGLELGADDYIPKPFLPRELVARVRAVLRRSERREGDPETGAERLRVGDLELFPRSRTARVGGEALPLTGTEFRLLATLMGSAGHLVPLETLSPEVLGRPHSPFDRSLGVHLSNLRRKLGPYPEGTERIRTVRGEGYVLVYPEGAAP